MKTRLIAGILLAGALLSAHAAPKDDVLAAAKKLGATSYTWKATTQMADMPSNGAVEGKAAADGLVVIAMPTFDGGTLQVVKKGDKTVINGEGGWQLVDVSKLEPGPGSFMAMFAQSVPIPARQTLDLANKASSVTLADGVYAGEMPEAAAKEIVMPFKGPPGGEGPTVANAKASFKMWLAAGALVKYEVTSSAKMNFMGEERPISTITTFEIKDVGTAKVEAPAEAKAKL